jgi:PPK2 family polyphosphate:nucleotide phosphotransferase
MTDPKRAALRKFIDPLRVEPGSTVILPHGFDPRHTAGYVAKADADEALRSSIALLAEYQDRLSAQDTYAVLVVLQGLDASGKDGTVKHVMSGVNPAGVHVRSFKVPSVEELNHDYLWRYARALPERGAIGIFNRSHYEEVLVVRVHPENLERQRLPSIQRGKSVWQRRFREINEWERYLVDNGIHIVKVFLNVSKEEQRRRFLERIKEMRKNWKFSAADVLERRHWDEYQQAYSDVLSNTSTKWAPWYVVPADDKWFTRLATASLVVDALMRIDPQYPEVGPAERDLLAKAKAELEAEG